ncbi:MAG: 3'-5' exonuclease [Candidatus Pacearchaeota archaeon]|nr:MAG: 3'-5' exonuclease [Candidatus Pacearchaeota archaeon]
MIVLDIETSGVDFLKCGIWQIGAVDLKNPKNQFLEESRIDNEDIVTEGSMKVTGKTEEEMRDENKQIQKELLERFFDWCKKAKIKNFICQNPQFDTTFLKLKASKYGLEYPFHHRAFDTHSIASLKYKQVKGKFLIEESNGQFCSGLTFTKIIEFCGVEDKRRLMKDGEIVKEGSPHNALTDAKLTAECFSRIVNGKNLLEEFKKFPIPKYLK